VHPPATTRFDVIISKWENDALGQAVAARLAAVAGPNLRVRILIDGGGNLFLSEPEAPTPPRSIASSTRWRSTRNRGGAHPQPVRALRPPQAGDRGRPAGVDGGRNFSQCAFFRHHDVTLVLGGPLVAQMQQRFDAYWEDQGGQPRWRTWPAPNRRTPPITSRRQRPRTACPSCIRSRATASWPRPSTRRWTGQAPYLRGKRLPDDSRLVVRLAGPAAAASMSAW